MAKPRVINSKFSCRKHHTCSDCGCRFSYDIKKRSTGVAPTLQEAETNAEAKFIELMQRTVEIRPCPRCGKLAKEMVAKWRAKIHNRLSVAAFFLLLLPVALSTAELLVGDVAYAVTSSSIEQLTPIIIANWAAVLGLLLLLIGHIFIAIWTPSSDSVANQILAAKSTKTEEPRENRQGTADDAKPSAATGGRCGFTFVLFLIAIASLASAELTRYVQGWPLNTDFHPPVVGSADRATIYFPQEVATLKELWYGEASATILNAEELAVEKWDATTKQSHWENEIQLEDSDSESAYVWAIVKVPDRPNLQGKVLDVQMNADIVYPRPRRDNTYEDTREHLTHQTRIQFASPGAGTIYQAVWWIGHVLSVLLFTVIAFRFSRPATISPDRQLFTISDVRKEAAASLTVSDAQSDNSCLEEEPTLLQSITQNYFEVNGFCFTLHVESIDGILVLDLYYQNRNENKSLAQIQLYHHWKPIRSCFPDTIEVECEGGVFGIVRHPLALLSEFQGSKQRFEVHAGVQYPDGQGDMLFTSDLTQVLRVAPRPHIAQAFLIGLAGATIVPPSVTLTLPNDVADFLPKNMQPVAGKLWRPGDPLDFKPILPKIQRGF